MTPIRCAILCFFLSYIEFKKTVYTPEIVARMHCMTEMCNSSMKCTDIISVHSIRIQQTLDQC